MCKYKSICCANDSKAPDTHSNDDSKAPGTGSHGDNDSKAPGTGIHGDNDSKAPVSHGDQQNIWPDRKVLVYDVELLSALDFSICSFS